MTTACSEKNSPHPLNMLVSLTLLVLIMGPLAGCKSEPVTELPPLIKVNDEAISKPEFLRAFNQTRHPDQPLSNVEQQELQHVYLLQLVDQKLIHAEARRRNIKVTADEIAAALTTYRNDYPEGEFESLLKERGLTLPAWQAELEESLAMEKLLDQAVYDKVEVSDTEIASYYEIHKEEFNRPEQVRARQIVVADEAEGQRLLGLLRQGQDFGALAEAHSLSPDAQEGGDLGFFGRGEMPSEFDAVVFDLPIGRLSDLVRSEYGYHIFLVEEKRKAARLSQAEAAAEIRALLESQQRETLYLEWLQELRSQAHIEVDWSQLKPAGQDSN